MGFCPDSTIGIDPTHHQPVMVALAISKGDKPGVVGSNSRKAKHLGESKREMKSNIFPSATGISQLCTAVQIQPSPGEPVCDF